MALRAKGRRTYIMVTLDSSDIYQHELIEQLLENGMDIARINCAHNTDREWNLIIKAIREAEEQLIQREKGTRSRCMILMDLGGPKIRTGSMELKVRPLKISVPKNFHGRAVRFVEGFLDTEAELHRTSQPSNRAIDFCYSNINRQRSWVRQFTERPKDNFQGRT